MPQPHRAPLERPAAEVFRLLGDALGSVLRGQARTIRTLLAACAAGGHVLLEDFPGTGKTTLAKALARALDVPFQRIQFTPDLLPSDILGVSVYDQARREFRLHRGPIFTTVLLADEINRASPRTQSALLEAMAEGQVSLDGELHPLDPLFFVVATQNPVELHGTYPLPEAQMDRFAVRLSLGYVDPEEELAILDDRNREDPLEAMTPVVSRDELLALRGAVPTVRIGEELKRYIVALVGATRRHPGVRIGASPRASLTLMKLAQALALADGMEFVTPDHLEEVAVAAVAHRLTLEPDARYGGLTAAAVMQELMASLPLPR